MRKMRLIKETTDNRRTETCKKPTMICVMLEDGQNIGAITFVSETLTNCTQNCFTKTGE